MSQDLRPCRVSPVSWAFLGSFLPIFSFFCPTQEHRCCLNGLTHPRGLFQGLLCAWSPWLSQQPSREAERGLGLHFVEKETETQEGSIFVQGHRMSSGRSRSPYAQPGRPSNASILRLELQPRACASAEVAAGPGGFLTPGKTQVVVVPLRVQKTEAQKTLQDEMVTRGG